MKSRPSYIILLLSALPILAGSCLKDPEYPPFIYETTEMSVTNADNAGENPVSDNDSVPRIAYALQLNLTMVTKEKGDSYEGSYIPEDVVTEFTITSPNVFNSIPPNEPLNNFFSYYSGNGPGAPVSITGTFTGLFAGSNNFGGPDTWYTTKYLLLMEPPGSAGNYTFFVQAGFDDGRVLNDTVTVKLY